MKMNEDNIKMKYCVSLRLTVPSFFILCRNVGRKSHSYAPKRITKTSCMARAGAADHFLCLGCNVCERLGGGQPSQSALSAREAGSSDYPTPNPSPATAARTICVPPANGSRVREGPPPTATASGRRGGRWWRDRPQHSWSGTSL